LQRREGNRLKGSRCSPIDVQLGANRGIERLRGNGLLCGSANPVTDQYEAQYRAGCELQHPFHIACFTPALTFQ
jgi:hypothetical protein